jgi:uncharacterized protein (TIGR03067 family)
LEKAVKSTVIFIPLLVLLVGSDLVADDADREELTKLQGTWVVLTHSEERVLPDDIKIEKVLVKGSQITFVMKRLNCVMEATLKISTTPKEIDLTISEGKFKGTRLPGIYELDGDSLKVCYNNGQKATTTRPKEFKADVRDSFSLMTLKRAKP